MSKYSIFQSNHLQLECSYEISETDFSFFYYHCVYIRHEQSLVLRHSALAAELNTPLYHFTR